MAARIVSGCHIRTLLRVDTAPIALREPVLG
jgi:hypothetical protein